MEQIILYHILKKRVLLTIHIQHINMCYYYFYSRYNRIDL